MPEGIIAGDVMKVETSSGVLNVPVPEGAEPGTVLVFDSRIKGRDSSENPNEEDDAQRSKLRRVAWLAVALALLMLGSVLSHYKQTHPVRDRNSTELLHELDELRQARDQERSQHQAHVEQLLSGTAIERAATARQRAAS